jgi:tRNA A-37 threonylcarbamoyl transferase component Bud32
MQQIGKTVAALHDGGLIHGDLTTSNMLFTPDDKLVGASSMAT